VGTSASQRRTDDRQGLAELRFLRGQGAYEIGEMTAELQERQVERAYRDFICAAARRDDLDAQIHVAALPAHVAHGAENRLAEEDEGLMSKPSSKETQVAG